jgi:hypothetical protein
VAERGRFELPVPVLAAVLRRQTTTATRDRRLDGKGLPDVIVCFPHRKRSPIVSVKAPDLKVHYETAVRGGPSSGGTVSILTDGAHSFPRVQIADTRISTAPA